MIQIHSWRLPFIEAQSERRNAEEPPNHQLLTFNLPPLTYLGPLSPLSQLFCYRINYPARVGHCGGSLAACKGFGRRQLGQRIGIAGRYR
jgi:hypothetical protein